MAASELNASAFFRTLTLQDAHTRIVLAGTILLGISGGIVGVFMLLRRRALIGDVVGHSALPGIAIAFIVCETFAPGSGRNLPALVLGAFLSGLAGAACVTLIDRNTPLKADAAMAITLSLFYGLGAALFTLIIRMPTAAAAGLNSYLYGKTALIVSADVWTFGVAALVLILLVILFFKEFMLLCFDESYAAATGWPVRFLDAFLTAMVVGVTIIGMQTVGLILVVAILIIPAVSARFWTDDLFKMLCAAATLGALAGAFGTFISATAARFAAGPVIVLCGSFLFVVSLLFGNAHGVFWRWLSKRQLQQQTGQHDLLRAIFEHVESQHDNAPVTDLNLIQCKISTDVVQTARSWSSREFRRILRTAIDRRIVELKQGDQLQLTPEGAALARRVVRNHRLWELYLINYAHSAPSCADYDADRIEHFLDPDIIRKLELQLAQKTEDRLPSSPH